MPYKVTINKETCDGDGECVEICPVDVWEIGDDGKAEAVNADECIGCESCVEVCPTDSITIEEV